MVSLLTREFQVVGTASTSAEAVQLASELHPDVMVLDLALSDRDGMELIYQVSHETPSPAVVVCTLESDPEVVDAAFKAGVLGYVFKARSAMDLVAAVKSAGNGHRFQSPS
jgi:DNA-binding NarL/FixJ family response regulator